LLSFICIKFPRRLHLGRSRSPNDGVGSTAQTGGGGDSVEAVMLFMVVEHFRDNDMVPVYQRLRQAGRSLPEGLECVDSWVAANFACCFQLMRCDDLRLIQAWILEWRGSGVTFDIVPVVTSAEARAVVEPHLAPPDGRPDKSAAGS
jgi:hypothetical protein